jgi:Ca2+/Na+ antiporter
MAQNADNSLSRFDRPSTSYASIGVGVLVFVLAVVGAILSMRDQQWPVAMLCLGAVLAFALFVFLIISRNRRLEAAGDRRLIKWNAAIPELQRQNVNLEVKELARLLDVEDDQVSDLLSAYIVAEDLALRQVQQEEDRPLLRHVQLGSMHFDAVLIEEDTITCIEVSFLVVPDVRQDKIESMLKKISTAKKNLATAKLRLRLRLMVVLVTQLSKEEEEHLRGMLITRRFTETPVDIDIRLLDFESLQKVYVTD